MFMYVYVYNDMACSKEGFSFRELNPQSDRDAPRFIKVSQNNFIM